MNILTKIVVFGWLKAFLITASALLLLLTIGNLVNQLMREVISAQETIINFLFELPSWINNIIPVACLSATLFSLEKLKTKNELVAILASGHSSKKIALDLIAVSGIIAIRLDPDDSLVSVQETSGEDHVLLITKKGKSIRFPESNTRAMGRATSGMRGIRLEKDDIVLGMEMFPAKHIEYNDTY